MTSATRMAMISNRGGYGYSERTPHGEHTDRGEYSKSGRRGRDSYHDRPRNEYEPPEDRYRRRDSRGRFRSEGDMDMRGMAEDYEMEDYGMEDAMDAYGMGGYGMEGAFTGYSPRSSAPRMHKIGFSGEEDEYEYPEMGGKKQKGKGGKKLTQEMAEEWMEGLENADESDGPHFDMGKVARIMEERKVRGNPLEYYVVLNSLYADYCKVFKKYGIGERLDFYLDMAKAFIEDEDAVDGKVAAYFQHIVK